MPDELEVSYSVKELLQQLNMRIDAFMTLLASKADQSSVIHVSDRIDQLEPRVTNLENIQKFQARHSSARQEFRRWIVPTLISLAAVAAAVFQVVHHP